MQQKILLCTFSACAGVCATGCGEAILRSHAASKRNYPPKYHIDGRSPMHSRADSVLDEASETCLRGTTQDDDYLCTAGAQ